jgi:hypothetical protein
MSPEVPVDSSRRSSTAHPKHQSPGSGYSHVLHCSARAFRVSGFWFRDSGFGFWVSGFGFRASGFRFRASGFGLQFSVFGFRVSGFGYGRRLGFTVYGNPAPYNLNAHKIRGILTCYSAPEQFIFFSCFGFRVSDILQHSILNPRPQTQCSKS